MGTFKTILVVGASVAAGMAIANYLTDGAVIDATSNVFNTVKDKVMNKGADVAETVGEVADDLADIASDIGDGVTI